VTDDNTVKHRYAILYKCILQIANNKHFLSKFNLLHYQKVPILQQEVVIAVDTHPIVDFEFELENIRTPIIG